MRSSRSELLDTSGLGTAQRISLQAPWELWSRCFSDLGSASHTPFKGNEAEETREGPKNVVYSRVKRIDSLKSHHSFHPPPFSEQGRRVWVGSSAVCAVRAAQARPF